MTLAEVASDGAVVIELLAAGVIVIHATGALLGLHEWGGLDMARLLLAEGVLSALGFGLAATLLKVIGLQQWPQIRTFATVFVLRTLLKRVFLQERANIEKGLRQIPSERPVHSLTRTLNRTSKTLVLGT